MCKQKQNCCSCRLVKKWSFKRIGRKAIANWGHTTLEINSS